jgi:hypothetical protein
MADHVALNSLSPREAVADALHRCILGIDSNDQSLFDSACLNDERLNIVIGTTNLEGWTMVNAFFQKLLTLVTTHIVTNVRIQLVDEATASLTAHAIAYHIRPEDAFKPEDTSYTASNLYDLDLVKDNDGLWKIKKWVIKALWTTGDVKVVQS